MTHTSLKHKWAAASGTVIFISYAAICIVLYLFVHSWLLEEERIKAKRTLVDVTTYLNVAGNQLTMAELNQQRGMLTSIIDQNQTVRIFSKEGQEVLSINDVTKAAPLELEFDEHTIDGTKAFVSTTPIQIGFFDGYIQLIHPLTKFQGMMRYLLTAMLLAGIGALIVSISIGYYLASWFIRPINALRDAMRAVIINGFQPTTLHYTKDDEIGELLTIYDAMMTELETAFKQQNQFVSDASHELRTPLHAIEGHLSLIQRWGKNDPEILDESLQLALDETKRMRTLMEELLALARRTEPTEESQAAFYEVVHQTITTIKMAHPTAEIKCMAIAQVNLAITPSALTQILQNIIVNAIHYSESPTIIITSETFPKYLQFSITDNGIGISEKDIPHIFDRFYRVDDARQRIDGSGLGLSIVKLLLQNVNGTITVTSKVGKGTTFTIEIPYAYAKSPEKSALY
ncbi:two-component sensor histidine kinase [Lysinibacillus alkalisoli]|uniref:Signal transduction histidine-protein kinase ArlS n=1 Tax=Lysinibacillus alkalisoli TaxID=1911548 RepID=A0A917LDJ4_9BACI|nr:HAMP domain-containing histidine kinase [Lysinibacillus alkalisoli]GGG14112.1 two-component sensor histidine kinase [Lysinibacillus alkalisoli]